MKSQTYKSLGVNVAVSVPSSLAEYDHLAGRTDAALSDATDSTVYRSVLNVFREAFVAAVASKTGTARKVTYKTDPATGEPLLNEEKQPIVDTEESAAVYIKRVAGENPEQFQAEADVVAQTLKFDPSVKERSAAGPKELAKRYTEAAEGILNAGIEVAQAVIDDLNAKHGLTSAIVYEADGTTVNKAATIASIGAAVKVDQNKQNLANQYTAGLV